MARSFTEEEVQRMVEEAVAKAVAPLRARIAELEAEVARLKKNSTTSSKPPSSDIIKPPRPQSVGSGKRRKRRSGAQPGHKRHIRPPFPPEQVDKTWVYEWETVPGGWRLLPRFRIVQQVELVEKPYRVTEHRARLYRNPRTGQVLAAALPPEVRQDQNLLRVVLPALQADTALYRSYVYSEEPPLSCPIHAYGGAEDPNVPIRPEHKMTKAQVKLEVEHGGEAEQRGHPRRTANRLN